MRPVAAVLFDRDGALVNTFVPAMHACSVAARRSITLAELEPVAHLGAARNLLSGLIGRPASDALRSSRWHADGTPHGTQI